MPTGSLTIDRSNGETAASLNQFFVTTVNSVNSMMSSSEKTCDNGQTFVGVEISETDEISAGIETLQDVIEAVAFIAKYKTFCLDEDSPAEQNDFGPSTSNANPNWSFAMRTDEETEEIKEALEQWEAVSNTAILVNSSQNANFITSLINDNYVRDSGVAASILIDQAIASKNTIRDIIFQSTGSNASRLSAQWNQIGGVINGNTSYQNLSQNPVFTQTQIPPASLGFTGGQGTLTALSNSRSANTKNVQPLSFTGQKRQINPLARGGFNLRQRKQDVNKLIASEVSQASAGTSILSFSRGLNWANGIMSKRLGNNSQQLNAQFATMSIALTAGTGTTITYSTSEVFRSSTSGAVLPLNASAFEDFASDGLSGSVYGWSVGVSSIATDDFSGLGYEKWNWIQSKQKRDAIEIFESGFPEGVKPIRVSGGSSGSGLDEKTANLSSQFDGSNQNFTMPEVYQTGSLRAYWNGQRLTNGDIVIETGSNPSSTFRLTIIGSSSDVLLVDYQPLTS